MFKEGQRVRVQYVDYYGKTVKYYAEVLSVIMPDSGGYNLANRQQFANTSSLPNEVVYYVPRTPTSGGLYLTAEAIFPVRTRKS